MHLEQAEIAQRLKVSRGTAPRLDAEQAARVSLRLVREAGSWSLAAIARLVEKTTGQACDASQVGPLLNRMGWFIPVLGGTDDALRIRFLEDPDGNRLCLFERTG
jgi:hypothetical protein